jgi:aldehyde dehydrogenase (NAD+)
MDDVKNFFIGGEWVTPASPEHYDVVSPHTEQVLARAPEATTADVDHAVAAARQAFDRGPWPRLSPQERAAAVGRLADLYEQKLDEFNDTISAQMGSPLLAGRGLQAVASQMTYRYYADLAADFCFSQERAGFYGRSLVRSEPVGVVATITAWNVPQLLIATKLAPALVAGCTVVVKPATETPLDSVLLADLIKEAGIPDGVVNIVAAGAEVSAYLVEHPDVDKVSFTGSTAVGRRLGQAFAGAVVGDPMDPATEVGPMISRAHRDRVNAYVTSGLDEGARFVTGGTPPTQTRGWYLTPTLLADATNQMRIAREEVFGPVMTVIPYDGEEEAIRIANDSDYGLASSVWTADIEHGLTVADQIRTGTSGVNLYATELGSPLGGFKASGIGREFGPEGLQAYLEPKTISIARGRQ